MLCTTASELSECNDPYKPTATNPFACNSYPSPRFGSCKSILALYRLSKKYDMEIVHRKTISLLGFLFPDTLSAYDAFWSSRGPISNPSVDEEILSSIDAIVFAAIDLGEHASLLAPCTLLWAVHLTGLDESALSYILSCIESHRRVAYFSNDARHNIIYAKRKLALFARRFLYPRLLSSKWSLCNLLQCIVARTRIISALGEPSGRPLDPFLPNSELFTLFSGCCPQCRTTCDDIAEGRKEAWEMLPNVFGLPPRKELREASGE